MKKNRLEPHYTPAWLIIVFYLRHFFTEKDIFILGLKLKNAKYNNSKKERESERKF